MEDKNRDLIDELVEASISEEIPEEVYKIVGQILKYQREVEENNK